MISRSRSIRVTRISCISGGSYANVRPYPASVWRCEIGATSGGGYRVKKPASIGKQAHAMSTSWSTRLAIRPNYGAAATAGYSCRDPIGNGEFVGQNNGLACLCSNFIAQHPTDPSIMFSGLQDNGTARLGGAGSMWTHVWGGDGGYCLINWNIPLEVLIFANGVVYRSTTGGTSTSSWSTQTDFHWPTMTQPIVGLPYNPTSPADAKLVAVGAGQSVFLSPDFGASWPTRIDFRTVGAEDDIFSLAFASPKRIFVGTTMGSVFRADRNASNWIVTRLDNTAGGALGLEGIVSDIAVDWAEPLLKAVYVAFGGKGDRRRVWWFDGGRWHERSGAGPTSLLDVEHNALAVDRESPNNVYVGADIGVWHSSNGGQDWQPLENGLPDAPVFDLQIHPTQRLLRPRPTGGESEIPLD